MATHPDWSPDGKQVVFATAKGDTHAGAGLAVIPWADNKWGVAKTIIEGAGGTKPPKGTVAMSNLFPMHSPDSKWIAFSRGKGGH